MEENILLIGGIREVVESYKMLKSLGLQQTPNFVINHVAKIFDGRPVQNEMNQNNESKMIIGIGTIYKVFKTLVKNNCEDAPQVFMDNLIEILGQETSSLPLSPPAGQPQVPTTTTPLHQEQEGGGGGVVESSTNGQVENEINLRINEEESEQEELSTPSVSSSSTRINYQPARGKNGKRVRMKNKKNLAKLSELKCRFKCVTCSAILNNNLEWWRHKTLVKCQNSRIECLSCKKSLFQLSLKHFLSHERVCSPSLKSYGSVQNQANVQREQTIMSTSLQAPTPAPVPSTSTASFSSTENPIKRNPVCETSFEDSSSHELHMEEIHGNSNNVEDNNHPVVIKVEPVEGNPFHPVSLGKKKNKNGRRAKPIYLCYVCQKDCQSYFALKNHLRVHTGDRPFQCPVCGGRFTQQSSLNLHVKLHDRPSSKLYNPSILTSMVTRNQVAQDENYDDSPPVLSPCGEYSSQFVTQNVVVGGESMVQDEGDEQDPLQLNLPDHDSDPEYDPRSFSLIPVRYRRRRGRRFRGKGRGLDPRFTCSECGKICRGNYDLKIHFRLHTNERPFKCPFQFCEGAFRCQSTLNSHTRRHQNPDGTPREIRTGNYGRI